jgi:hypothetical protein
MKNIKKQERKQKKESRARKLFVEKILSFVYWKKQDRNYNQTAKESSLQTCPC